MKWTKAAMAMVAMGLVAGCSNTTHISKTVIEGATVYNVVVQTGSVTGRNGSPCVGSTEGIVWLKGSEVGGVITDDHNRNYRIKGTVDAQQRIEAGIAVNGQLAASWGGSLNKQGGSGSWRDESGCHGTWQASRS